MPAAWSAGPVPDAVRAEPFDGADVAGAEGVLMRSADQYAMGHGRAPNAVRLAVAGNCTRADLERGVGMLARLLANPPNDMAV